jgi:hypothetical protein
VCQPVVGTFSFHDTWEETRWGTLRQGGYLTVQYDIDRLPGCRGTHDGHPAWDVVAFARFLPGGQILSGSVRGLVTDMGTPTSEGVDLPWTTRIPADAEAVELWFQNHTGAGSSCQSWDSDFGRNYRAEVWPDAEHPRCRDVELETGIRTESELQAHNAPYCLGYDLAGQLDADHCEFHVDGFGNGHVGHYGFPYDWLVAYLRTGPQGGQVLAAGMFTRFHDVATGAPGQRFSLGVQVEPGLWRTGFAYHVLGMGGLQPADRVAEEMSFFIDVRRPSGEVVRLWHSRHGADYSWTDAFGLPTTSQGVPYGSVQWAHPDAAVLESRRACR